jgi:hypothetical protein
MGGARLILTVSPLAVLAACGLLGSTASTVGSLGSLASQGSGASSAAVPDLGGSEEVAAPVGQICGNPDIQGQVIPEIEGDGLCGVRGAVQVASVSGVTLSPQPTITCETAAALDEWVKDGAKLAVSDAGARLEAIDLAAHYSCAPTDAPGHAGGEAIDVTGFRLGDGDTLSFHRDWSDPARGPTLRTIHARACGPFSRAVGPDALGPDATWAHYDIADRDELFCR